MALVLGAGYLLLIATNNRSSAPLARANSLEYLPLLLLFGVVGFVVWAWTLSRVHTALIFSLPEVAFLFPAPLARRSLLQFKLARSQLIILLNVVLWILIAGRPDALPVWMRAISIWCVFSTLALHKLGAAFARTSLRDHGEYALQKRVLAISAVVALVALAAAAVLQVAGGVINAAPGSGMWAVLRDQLTQPIPAAALAPFWAVVRPLNAATPTGWWAAIGPALLVLLLHYLWVLRSDSAFEESAAQASVEHARELRSRRFGRQGTGRRRYSPPVFRLRPAGPPAMALVWKNLAMVLRRSQLRLWGIAVIGSLAGITLLAAAAPAIGETLGALLLVWGGFLFLLGPQWIRNDLRSDLGKLDLLRSLPVAGDALIRAEAAGAALTLTLGQAALLAVGLAGVARSSGVLAERGWLAAAAAVVLLPSLNYAGMLLQNGAALLYPAWVRVSGNRGIESLGQHMLGALGYLFSLLLLLVPATLVGGAIYALLHPGLGDGAVLAAIAVLSAVLLLEAWLLSLWLGSVYDRTDPPAAGIDTE